MKPGRKPRHDELELWRQVARQVVPLGTRIATPLDKATEAKRASPKSPHPLGLPRIGGGKAPLPNDLAPSLTQSFETQPVRMDHGSFKRMRRGRIRPEATIDLHGMTTDRAHAVLLRFVMAQQAAGKRLVLVITGKGKPRDDDGPIPVRPGVLRHQVPQWLRLPPLSSIVLQVTQAHFSHGGEGAYYVYLRKTR